MKPTPQEQFAITKRRHEVQSLYLQGVPQHLIAARYDVHRTQIVRDLQWIKKQWIQSTTIGIDARKLEELAKIDELEREAWKAWRRSKRDAERRKAVVTGEKKTAEQVTEGQCGDPRFLAQIERCIKLRLGIIGISTETTHHEHAGQGGKPIPLQFITYSDAKAGKPFESPIYEAPIPDATASDRQGL